MRRSFPAHSKYFFLPVLVLCLTGTAGTAFAATLKAYREDLQYAANGLTRLYSLSDDGFGNGWTKEKQLELEKNLLDDISQRLPDYETVEWKGVQTEVDNRWLRSRLEDLKKLPVGSRERDPIVNELTGRLFAIDAQLADLESATGTTRDKDAEKQKLSQILNRLEYQPPEQKEKSAIERWWESFTKWLSGLFPEPKPLEPLEPVQGPAIGPGIVQVLIIVIALAVIAFVIWRFAPVFRSRRLKKEKKDGGERIILGERLAANESSATLFEQAESMAREGNFRGAIRKGYIALLCELGDHKIVRLAQHKTNRDYLRDVGNRPELQGGMRQLTSSFENHWYGLATASEEEWGAFREGYRYSINKL